VDLEPTEWKQIGIYAYIAGSKNETQGLSGDIKFVQQLAGSLERAAKEEYGAAC